MKKGTALILVLAMSAVTAVSSAAYGIGADDVTTTETKNYSVSEAKDEREAVYSENLSFVGEIIVDSVYEDQVSQNANDGDIDTIWRSNAKGTEDDNAWIGLDMKDIARMDSFIVCWVNSYPAADGFYVEASDDCVNWTKVSYQSERNTNFTGTAKAIDYINFYEPIEARAVRVVCYRLFVDENGNSKENPGVSELSVFGLSRKYAAVAEQPADAAVSYGEIAHASVKAVGDGLVYQWYYKDADMKEFKKSSITDSTYFCKMIDGKSGRQVYCVITDKYGNYAKSETASLQMTLSLIKHPESTVTQIGETVRVTAVAKGDGLEYQWYVKEQGAYYFSKSSVRSATYSYTMTAAKANREVYCVIQDKYGNYVISDTAMLYAKAHITKQPVNGFAQKGKTAEASVKAVGEGLTYQWYYKNASMKAYAMSSVTDSTYFCAMSESKHGRQVYCVVTDKFGNRVISDIVTLSLTAYIEKQPEDIGVNLGEEASVTVHALGEGLTYQWFVKNPGEKSFVVSSVTKASYSYTMTKAKSGRQVYCVITDKYGNSATTDTVTLYAKPTVTSQPVNTETKVGETAKITVKAVGEGLTYQWYYKNTAMKAYAKSSAATANYSCDMTESKHGRQVYCVITDKYGNSVKSNTVTLKING